MIEVLYEDNHIIAINKKPSDIVQRDKTGDKPLSDFVKEYLVKKYNKKGEAFLGVVHRIDRPVSGVLLFAKTSKSLSRLNNLFKNREIQKTYWAIVKNPPPNTSDKLIHFLKKNQQKNKSKAYLKEEKNTLKSELKYRIIKKLDRYFLLEISPKTGRHHQIRVQLSKIGSPIKGDVKYGASRSNKNASIHLHARMISFIHPIKKENIEIIAPPPKETLWNNCV